VKYTIHYSILLNAIGTQHAFAVEQRKKRPGLKGAGPFLQKTPLQLFISLAVERAESLGCLAFPESPEIGYSF
jgi:hypothetical protein